MFEKTSPVEATQQTEANKMIRNGATLGMVVNFLRSQGLNDEQCKGVIQIALQKDIKRKRILAVFWILFGLALVAGGIGLTQVIIPAPGRDFQFFQHPLALAFLGGIIVLFGIVSLFQVD